MNDKCHQKYTQSECYQYVDYRKYNHRKASDDSRSREGGAVLARWGFTVPPPRIQIRGRQPRTSRATSSCRAPSSRS